MPTATPSDVTVEIDTVEEESDIAAVIERVARDIDREMDDPPADGTDDRQDLVAVLAAMFIATSRDRAESEASTGRTAITYEASMVDQLRSRAARLGAPDSLLGLAGTRRTASITAPDAKNWRS
jgi:hypothetical protein